MVRTRRKVLNLTALVGVAVLLILIAIVYGARVSSARSEQLASSVFEIGLTQLKVSRVFTSLLEAESSQRGFLVTHDEAYLAPFNAARNDLHASLPGLEDQLAKLDPSLVPPSMDELRTLVERKFAELDETVALARQGRTSEALAIVRGNLGLDLMARARQIVDEELATLSAFRTRRVAEMQDSARNLALLTTLGVMSVVLLSLFAAAMVFQYNKQLDQAQQKLVAANDELEFRVDERTRDLQTANEEIQRYAYIVSHDLRAPLVNIIGFTKELETAMTSFAPLLASPGLDRDDPAVAPALRAIDEDIPEALRFIEVSTARMDGLITAILNLSRLGRLPLKPEDLDLNALTMDCIASLQHRINEEGAVVAIEGRLPRIWGDRRILEQVVGNLLDNAVKYLSSDRAGRVVVRGRRVGGNVLIEIEDNGRGVAPSDQDRIFDLFRRAGKQDRPGEGIGLAHVRALVRRLGGEIAMKSDGTTGSVFSITLPSDLRRALSKGVVNV
ncbi:MAG: CHASE3 domain-containing protein [Beijerinckiaceae bacterium]|nr:CHASE3 domain-containing protein [Beijerinckiaceae bacterium]